MLAVAVVFGIATYVAFTVTSIERTPLGQPPSTSGLAYENVSFPSRVDLLALRGWYIPAKGGESSRSVILVHGREHHRADASIGMPAIAAALAARGYNVLAFDTRAHGESAGERLSFGYFETRDIMGAVDYLESRGAAGKWVGAVAFSLGAAATLLALPEEPRIKAVVADSCYADMTDMLEYGMTHVAGLPAFFGPPTVVMARVLFGIDIGALKPEAVAGRIAPRPLLLVHGEIDDTVPVSHARRLAAAYPKASLWITTGVNHVKSYATHPEEYLRRVEATFAQSQP